ncbi:MULTISPECIES: type IV pilus secretin PilQ [unclassified Marinobacter]|jgi:type IV pilus assembly protein PilQ|uniref:type IV pilus secretin PilQ n=1 Tax=unclassified Marinobacter TaxID=83889 RepID=UPI0020103EFA|nr:MULTISPECIES: type IV pilus secretin PilQ [unclassified Marinobacter]MCL1476378.1 type IV pilus secretin PilQ [Marinobacter sp.]MCL1482645.1 type IV pilus secretin PilQ [Marinobacter sp.]MCL1485561.1 type IV pilus secretin PilQ [Marinobacter sp.]UQG56835.1 type IV pilus secretin PilQ [Marinobacter sp. M4C]UQG65639.1 type IV pilus secretin PilQ [Marinobacter sp. M2C]
MNNSNMNAQKCLKPRLAMFKKLNVIVCAVTVGLLSSLASAATLQDVSFSSLPGDRLEVTLQFDGPPPEPTGYTIERPARIAVDLKDTTSALGARSLPLGSGNAQSMTVVETNDRTRLIFNLIELVPYTTQRNNNALVMIIGGDSADLASGVSGSDGASPVASAADAAPALVDVDFRRGAQGEGRVVVRLASATTQVDLSELGGKIRLTMPDLTVPERLRRRLDVTDFATPVQRIDTFIEGGGAVIEIRPEGDYDYIAYQSGSEFTVSVERLSEEEAVTRREEKFPYSGDKLSLNFQDIEVRSVLQLIADFTGLNLVASDTVGGSITLRLQNVPWDQALDLILKTKGLDKRQIGNVLLVAPADEIAARERLELETTKQIAELAPVRLDIIQVNYAKAAEVVALVQADQELISSRGFISSDDRTNTISVRETIEKLDEIRRLVSTWDVPVRQVSIEARIVRAQTNVAESLGVSWGGAAYSVSGNNVISVGGSQSAVEEARNAATGGSGTITFPGALAVDLGVSGDGASSFAIGFGSDDFLVDLELSALESDGKAEIVSQPRVVTADRQTASIKSGQEIPYQEASSSGATSTSFKEAVLSLEVTPQITPDDKIIMDLEVTQDSRGEDTPSGPAINTNSVTTQVLVANGETIVLGGIFESTNTETTTKTPFLGDIPYLGRLFKRTQTTELRSELLIFITPKIIKNDLVR